MNWNSLKKVFEAKGAEAAKQTLEQLPMKVLKQLAVDRCAVQPYQRAEYAGTERKLALIVKIYEYLLRDVNADAHPSETALQHKFLNSALRKVFQDFKTAFPNARPSDFWGILQRSVPVERWNGGYEHSPITGTSRTSKAKTC